jgi:hypothetical protein
MLASWKDSTSWRAAAWVRNCPALWTLPCYACRAAAASQQLACCACRLCCRALRPRPLPSNTTRQLCCRLRLLPLRPLASQWKAAPLKRSCPALHYIFNAGRSHGKVTTFPRLADPLGFVPADDIFHLVKAVVAVQRDYGRRDDRKQARLKYLINEWGVEKFRSVVEQYYGKKMQVRTGRTAVQLANCLPQNRTSWTANVYQPGNCCHCCLSCLCKACSVVASRS